MKLLNSTDRYGLVAQALHWLTAALVMIGWTLGTLGDDLPRDRRFWRFREWRRLR